MEGQAEMSERPSSWKYCYGMRRNTGKVAVLHYYFSVKKRFIPRVTHGTTLHQHNLELLMGQFYTKTTLMYSRDHFTPVELV